MECGKSHVQTLVFCQIWVQGSVFQLYWTKRIYDKKSAEGSMKRILTLKPNFHLLFNKGCPKKVRGCGLAVNLIILRTDSVSGVSEVIPIWTSHSRWMKHNGATIYHHHHLHPCSLFCWLYDVWVIMFMLVLGAISIMFEQKCFRWQYESDNVYACGGDGHTFWGQSPYSNILSFQRLQHGHHRG